MVRRTPLAEETRRIATCLIQDPMECPFLGCTGHLVHRSPISGRDAEVRRGSATLVVPMMHIACDGETVHLYSKVDLIHLRSPGGPLRPVATMEPLG